jgi:Flp pilus assembly protein TadG
MRSKARCERGAAMVETALTVPLVLLLSISVYEFGRAFQHWQVLTNATREGARIAVLPGTTDDAVEARIASYLEAGRIAVPEDLGVSIVHTDEISIGPGAGDTATASTVSVNYPFKFVVLQPVMQLVAGGSDVGAPITMNASATMRNE